MPCAALGLDIGGANLKAAHSNGAARLEPFELWKDPRGLPDALRALVKTLPRDDLLAVTMTGELCDCFESKRQGVHFILDAVETMAGSVPVRVWQTNGKLVDLATARAHPHETGAANWLALAVWAGRYCPSGSSLLIDIGSTTTDIVPLLDGRPIPRGRTDPERLQYQELVYTGISRTPACALLGAAGAAELFATTLDVYLVLGQLPENDADRRTADGRPATRAAAHARLARMLCGDGETCTKALTRNLALQIQAQQVDCLRTAVKAVSAGLREPPQTVVLAGAGEFLARTVLNGMAPFSQNRVLSLTKELGAAVSRTACAYALAILASESCQLSVVSSQTTDNWELTTGNSPAPGAVVVKVGGSLFDLPDLGPRLQQWLARLRSRQVVLVPGGGRTVDVVRELDRFHGLGEEAAHWLALRVLTLNAHFLAALLPGTKAVVVGALHECASAWARGLLPVIDGHSFARADEGEAGALPHRWTVTSDSLAARVATALVAARLYLLKSVAIPAGMDWVEASSRGFVDAYFVQALTAQALPVAGMKGSALEIQAVDFRAWRP